jgi:hypothetical protein
MEENCSRLHFLVSQIHETHGLAPPPVPTLLFQSNPFLPKANTAPASVANATTAATTTIVTDPIGTTDKGTTIPDQTVDISIHDNKKQRYEDTTSAVAAMVADNLVGVTHVKKNADGTEHILAASALCQLAGPEDGSGGSSLPSANNSVVELLLQDPVTGANISTANAANTELGENSGMNVMLPGISEDQQQQHHTEESWSTSV